MGPDKASFFGNFDGSQWWTGERAAGSAKLPVLDQSTPRATLRSFLLAGDLARAGVPDAIGRAAMVTQFTGVAGGLDIMQQVQLAQDLFDLVDMTTVTLWKVPESSYDDEISVTLPQLGSDVLLTLQMRRLRGGLWWIMCPDAVTMAKARTALLARFGGRPPAREADDALPTPRDAMRAFLQALADWNGTGRASALETLDLHRLSSATREDEGTLDALFIAHVLLRVGPVITQMIPDDPGSRNPYVYFSHPAGRIAIGPVDEGGKTHWRFTDDTIDTARDLYAAMSSGPAHFDAILALPDYPMFRLRHAAAALSPFLVQPIGGLRLEWWQAGLCAGTLTAAMCLAAFLVAALHLLPHRPRTALLGLPYGIKWPIVLTVMGAAWQVTVPIFGLPHPFMVVAGGISAVALAAGIVWAGWQLIDLVGHYVSRAGGAGGMADEIVTPLAIGTLRVALVGAALIYVADALSIPYSGLIAGLGISGLALAFASKETLSNIFGAAILVVDRPFRRGDSISVGDTKGVVEHVGIRSTRIRTSEDSLIVLPNGKLSDATINNLGTRRHRLTSATLVLPYSMTPEAVSDFVAAMKDLVEAIPEAAPGRTDVSVTALTSGGVQVDLSCYLQVGSGASEKIVRQSLMLDLIRLGDRMGVPVGPGHTPRLLAPTALAAE